MAKELTHREMAKYGAGKTPAKKYGKRHRQATKATTEANPEES